MSFEEMMKDSYHNIYYTLFYVCIIAGIILISFFNRRISRLQLLLLFIALCLLSHFLAFTAIVEKWDYRFEWLKANSEIATETQASRITTDGANKIFGPILMTFNAFFFFLSSYIISLLIKRRSSVNYSE